MGLWKAARLSEHIFTYLYVLPQGHLSLYLNSGSSYLLGTNVVSVKDLADYVYGLCGNPMGKCGSCLCQSR